MRVKYTVNLGHAETSGTVFCNPDLSEYQILLAIYNDLYCVDYTCTPGEGDIVHVNFEVNIGGACYTGETIVRDYDGADFICVSIMNALPDVSYQTADD